MAKGSKTITKKPGALSALHRLFAHEIVRPGASAASAYRSVYPNASEATAATNGPALLRKAHVAAYVEKLREKQVAKIDAKAQKVLDELEHIGMARMASVLDLQPDGSVKIKPVEQWGENERAGLTDIDVKAIFEGYGEERTHIGNVVKVAGRGKVAALETLAKHHRLLVERIEADVTVKTHAELIAEAHRRLAARPKTDGGEE